MNLLNHDIQHGEVFYVLDFDRCLGKTEKLQELLEKAITREGIVDLAMIQYAHAQVKKTGGSFDTAAYVRQVLKDRQLDVDTIWERIENGFVALAQTQDTFEPYAKELLDLLQTRGEHYGIVTYGGAEWQKAKLKAAGLDGTPHLITSHKEKGRLIASWQQKDKRFLIPKGLAGDVKRLQVARIVFIDDKPVSFAGIPAEVEGICVSPVASAAQLAALPKNVSVVHGMQGVIQKLFMHTIDKT